MRVVLLALLCAACFVHAALPGDGSCAPAGAAWAPVTDADLPEPVVGALLNALFSSSVANATALEACPPDALDLTAAGCALVRPPSPRVVAGTKYELLINATCGGVPFEGVLARVFAPLPSANEPVSVDLEVLAAAAGLGAAAATSATAGAATSSGGTPSFVRSEDLDYYGGELPDQQPDQQWWNCGLDSPDACEDLCANRTDCLMYSWVPVHPRCEGPTCYLKGDATAVTCLRAAPGVVSGRREPVTGDAPSCAVKVPNLIDGCIFTIQPDTGLEGGAPLAGGTKTAANTAGCCRICIETAGCKGFVFTKDGGACALVADFGYSLVNTTGATAGVV